MKPKPCAKQKYKEPHSKENSIRCSYKIQTGYPFLLLLLTGFIHSEIFRINPI